MKLNEIKITKGMQEARRISKEVITVIDMVACQNSYNEAYNLAKKEYTNSSVLFLSQIALTDIYVAGYIAGVRAEREKRRKKNTSTSIEVND
ncbi:hypothetical protein [Peptostreptococcus porci]|uniref:hypothetical protein n=1 Tax=Peptostreptococcus porci TaxID=2652282 RepID=UPI002A908819|nr:hypothetical protein [Peptostreptococcus porci]MDY6231922.1 hypothetical protein [Peptostreptococcus porci]